MLNTFCIFDGKIIGGNVYYQITIVFKLTATDFKNLVGSKGIELNLMWDQGISRKLSIGNIGIHVESPRAM